MTVTERKILQLTTTPETVTFPAAHYVFVEKLGPFATNAPLAWEELHKQLLELEKQYAITRYFSLYKVEPQIYRAGVSLASAPARIPEGLRYEEFYGGKYGKFTLTGSYSNLPAACGRVFHIVSQINLPLRDDFNIENYVNDPRVTPEDQLITEIMFPLA